MWQFCHVERVLEGKCCDAANKRLHPASTETNLGPADALRRTAFLDVSSLNFGGATSTAVFLCEAFVIIKSRPSRAEARQGGKIRGEPPSQTLEPAL